MVRRGACAEGGLWQRGLTGCSPWEVVWSWELISPHSLGQSPGKWDGHESQHPPAGSSWEQPPWCAHFPDCHSSGFGCGCWFCRLGLVPCRLCHEAQSTAGSLCMHHLHIIFFLLMLLQFCLPSSTISRIILHPFPCAKRNCPHLPLEAARHPLLTHCYHLQAWEAKLLLPRTHHLSWNRLVNKMAQCEIHLFHQVALSLGYCCFVLC